MDMRRPYVVTESSRVDEWPMESIAAFNKGFSVCQIRSDEWNIVMNAVETAPVAIFRVDEKSDLAEFREEHVEIKINTLGSRAVRLSMLETIDDPAFMLAGEMHSFLASHSPSKVFCQTESYKCHQRVMLHPEWGFMASVRYWVSMLLGKEIQWGRFDGEWFKEVYLSVNVGMMK